MMGHKKDNFGLPLDPELNRLERRLAELTGQWAVCFQNNDIDGQAEAIKEYHLVMAELYARGWDDILEWDMQLPVSLMPKEYGASRPNITDWQRALTINEEQQRKQQAAVAARSPWQRLQDWLRDHL